MASAPLIDAFGRLDARGNVNGPGPRLKNPLGHISGMQATRQNERTGHVGGNEGPIENLSAAAVAFDVGVEQMAWALANLDEKSNKSKPGCMQAALRQGLHGGMDIFLAGQASGSQPATGACAGSCQAAS